MVLPGPWLPTGGPIAGTGGNLAVSLSEQAESPPDTQCIYHTTIQQPVPTQSDTLSCTRDTRELHKSHRHAWVTVISNAPEPPTHKQSRAPGPTTTVTCDHANTSTALSGSGVSNSRRASCEVSLGGLKAKRPEHVAPPTTGAKKTGWVWTGGGGLEKKMWVGGRLAQRGRRSVERFRRMASRRGARTNKGGCTLGRAISGGDAGSRGVG